MESVALSPRRRRLAGLAVLVAVGVTVAGCGGQSNNAAGPSPSPQVQRIDTSAQKLKVDASALAKADQQARKAHEISKPLTGAAARHSLAKAKRLTHAPSAKQMVACEHRHEKALARREQNKSPTPAQLTKIVGGCLT